MNTVTLYKNPNPYPFYGSISTYKTVSATPRNQDIKAGYIDMSLTMDEVFSFNYLSFKRNNKTVYGWVENVEELGGNTRWRVYYTTDPFRTYRGDLVLGTQYIVRGTTPTKLEDNLLSSTQEHNDYSVSKYQMSNPALRYAVVQRRRGGGGENMSNTVAQPTPYQFYFVPYNVNNWVGCEPLRALIDIVSGQTAATSNIVTIYSVPFIDTTGLVPTTLSVKVGSQVIDPPIAGWYHLNDLSGHSHRFNTLTDINFPSDLTLTSHSVKLVFPEAGIMNIPDEFLKQPLVKLRQDIDIFSGACNYMLTSGNGDFPSALSVRGGSLSTIPILSSPYETYISQNQNTMAVGLLGDVANLGVGLATSDPIPAMAGGMGLVNTFSSLEDAKSSIPSNPPAYLGSALVGKFNQKFYLIVTKKPYDNASEVNARYGYPTHKLKALSIPSSGFVQTSNCSVSSNGNVPLWAISEINQLFNAGILFK